MGEPYGLLYSFPITGMLEQDIADINNLLSQLSKSPRQITPEILARIVKQPHVFSLMARDPRDDHIVGTATLAVYETLMRNTGIIEDVVVDQNHRRQNISDQLLESLIKLAKVRALSNIDLSSNPERVVANQLYQKHGFERRDTNSYRLVL